ncbi:ribonucleoside-diphosphate reductase alpha chain [Halalkaliarchaeum desulfuricum]|uniref:Ribonucleoside-diphosphate reductase n=1 Tax=Halalkaliarchaeum desulfuricum TaxID=2055893 RepID=A0A343TIB2_9EURY|nr:LAGLIDADG family homing endonuclease [Halalkaliarchaeum desulfuricum]AUX08834.1 ribonucleoside-diphosphate reductase alpha chain [Halalkaliarchaeum desulfuricum]
MSDAEHSIEDTDLPIKRTEGETLRERLTDNAYENILPARYLRKDADGELIETQEDLFVRIARNIALAEAVFEAEKRDVEITVTPEQLKPDHPRREELAEEVFGKGVTPEDDAETTLSVYNVNKFAYETIVPELPAEISAVVEEKSEEFRRLMESLSFIPNCVPSNSLVAAGGGMKPLGDIQPGERVYDDVDGNASVEEKYRNGRKAVLEIETDAGYTVRATPEHYFRIIDENGEYAWRQVKELDTGDTIALQRDFLDDDGVRHALGTDTQLTDGGTAAVPSRGRDRLSIDPPEEITPEFAEWLGLYVGDGTARESGVRMAFDDADEDLVDYWVSLTESVFGFEPTVGHHGDAACIIGRASRRDLYDFLNANDLLKESSKTAAIPEAVLQSGRTIAARFLRGLFEADGTVGDRSIELYTHSEALASQVQKLLLGLGIRSAIRDKRDGYRVRVRKNRCGKHFVERVGFISDRKTRRSERFETVADSATSLEIPNQSERLLEWYRESDLGHDAYRDLSQFLIDPDSEYHQVIGEELFETYAEKYPELWDSPVAEHVERDQFYETVSEITELGTMAVEDMQVPRRNTYVVEGFVSHNSPTIMNAGDELQQLSACFVDSPDDDITDIHQTMKEAAEVFQCLTDETTVFVDGKGVVSIADVEPGDEIRGRDGEGHRTRRVEETHAYDDAPVFRVVTEAGIELTGTPNHELCVGGDWTRIDEIDPGDALAVRLDWIPDVDEEVELETVENRNPTNETGRVLDEGTVAEIGVASESDTLQRSRQTLEPNGRPVKTVTQPSTLTTELAELVGMWVGDGSLHEDGIRFHLRREETLEHADRLCRELFDEGLDWQWADGCYDAVLHSHEIKRFWLENFGDAKPDSTTASVPEPVRHAGHDVITGFLRGLYSTDGSLQKGAYPRLWSASAELIDDVQQLLVGLGIPAASWESDSPERDYYNVGPTGEAGLERFVDLVGFVDGRTEEMRSKLAEIDHAGTTFGTIDGSTWEVPVERVEAAGTDTVYDVTVETEPEYVASSVVSHNSGGGMGYAFWKLRPYGDAVGSTGGIASGPITFMRTYDQMCFVPGTKILTPGGTTPIEELEEGQLVIDEHGDAQPVTETMERFVDEEIVEITPKRINKPIRVTEEHPFKVARDSGFEWVDAGDLDEDDRLVFGHWNEENDLAIEGTVDLTQVASGPLVFSDGGVVINRDHYGVSKGTKPKAFESEVPTKDLATIAGWYLAEGSIRYQRGIPSTVTFTLNNDERAAAEEIQEALRSFGVDSRIREVEDRNTLHVHAEHTSFAGFIEGTFGTGASEKSVPRFLWNAPTPVQARVLETLFEGDGRLEKRGKSQRVQLKLANEEIVDFVFQVGVRCGVQFSRHDRTPEDRQPTYSVSASVSTALGTPLERLFEEVPDGFSARDRTKQANGREVVAVDAIERTEYSGPVYNAEVAGTHTYVAEDVVVHNCETIAQGGARRGAQMGVMRVSHPDVIQFIHAKNKDVSLAHSLRLNDPDDYTHNSFAEALEEARELIDDEGRVPKHLRNAVEGHLSNFNISVGVTDDFMEALANDEEFTFTNPRTEEPHVTTPETKELYDMFGLGEYVEVGEVLSVPAAELWQDIVEGAHENGEPGVIYLERVNKQHSFDVEEHPDHRILSTNPCVTGDTLISTESGLIPAEELYEQGVARDVVVDGRLSDDRVKEASSVFRTGEKEVYKLTTEEGYELRLTADHRVMTDDGWVEAGDLDAGDTVHIQNRKGEFGRHGSGAEGRVLGWLVGDGHLKDGEERAILNFYDEDAEISEDLAADVDEVVRDPVGNADYEVGVSEIGRSDEYRGAQAVEQRIRSVRLYEMAAELGLTEQKFQVPDAVMQGSEEMARGFLQALFTADGSVQGSKKNGRSIRLASSHRELLKEVQQLLLNFGIASRIYENRRPEQIRELPDGNGGTKEYETRAQHELAITKDNQQRFARELGFLREDKNDQLEKNLDAYTRGPQTETFVATVEEVTPDGYEEVFDLTEPETHSFVASGLVTHNCGEQPLEEYEACNLGHINLSTLAALDAPDWRAWSAEHGDEYDTQAEAVEAFLEEAIDFEEFDYRIDRGTRFLENVVTMSDFPVPEIEEKVREMRKIGLGIMGLAQLYIQLGVRYGSETGNEIARQLMTHINHTSKWTSHELATDRGSFDDWDDSKYANPTEYAEWFEHHTGLDATEWEEGFPIRNHNTTTIAPTGCVDENSLISTDEGLQPIKELDETTAEFEQWDDIEVGVSTDGGTKTATAVYDNGFADVRRIETEGGFSVAATPNHRFRTLTDDGEYVWREADDFESGDTILLQRDTFQGEMRASLDTSEERNRHWNSAEALELPSEMTPELAEFLGYFMGDGYVHDDVGVKLVVESDAEELDAHLRELGESLFGVEPTVEDRDTRHMLVFGGRHLPRYFEDNGWKKADGNAGEGAASAFVPEDVLAGDEAVAKAFLRGLFEADGTASRKVELSTVSETLANQVQTLLLSLGVVFVRDVLEMESRDDHFGDRPRHCIRGANKREDKRFLEEIGFVTKATEIELTAQSYKNDTYPPAVVEALRDVDGYDAVDSSVKHRVNQSPRNGSVSRKLVRDVEAETGETVRLDGRRLTDFYAATVEEVTEEKAYTKDISVPSNNTYLANGFVTHNTTSMLGNTTGGCEPIYNVAYYKNVTDDVQGDEMLVEFDDYFLRTLEANGIDVEAVKREAQEQMAANEFDGVEGLSTVPDAIGELFVITEDLSGKQHAAVQCACQEGVDSAISKTCNFPNDATVEDMDEVYRYIYDHGGKGVTVYRDGTRSKQVLTTRAKNTDFADESEAAEAIVEQIQEVFGGVESFLENDDVREALDTEIEALLESADGDGPSYAERRPRPDSLTGVTQRIDTGYGKMYVTINEDENGEPFELFANIGHSGGFTNSFTEALAKVISTALRSGVDPHEIVDELQGTRSPKVAWDKGEQIQSIPDAIGTAMRRYLDDEIEKGYPQQQRLEEAAGGMSAAVGDVDADATSDVDDDSDEETDGRSSLAENGTGTGVGNDDGDGNDDGIDATQALIDAGESPECPECGSMSLYYSEGCKTCESCGWSEC